LALPVFIVSLVFLAIIHFVPAARDLFGMSVITFSEFLLCLVTALVSVGWFELYKYFSAKSLSAQADEKHVLALYRSFFRDWLKNNFVM